MEKIKHVRVDTHPDCYNVALIRGWAERMMAIAGMPSELDDVVFDFVAELRSIAHSARLPLDMLRSLQSFHDGYVRDNPTPSPVERVAGAFAFRVGRSIPGLTHEQLTAVRGICLDIGQQLGSLRDDPRLDFPMMKAWNGMLSTTQFQIQLWGLQRTCYVAIYNAYDSFVVRCISLISNDPGFRRGSPERFAERATAALGHETFLACCQDEGIVDAALNRHAISHAAGKRCKLDEVTNKPRFSETEDVHTTVTDVRNLLRLVQERGYTLATTAAKKLATRKPR
jgi:hypothetical protein